MAWPTLPSYPDDIENFCRNKSNKHSKRVLFLFSGVAWSLWLIRNELVFQNLVVPSPNVGIFRSISYLFYAEMENTEQGDGSTVDRRGDTKAESSTVIIKA
jgi:hypothetical protein